MRTQIFEGRLPLPSRNKFVASIGEHYTRITERMFNALWYAYLHRKGTISTIYWSQQFDNAKVLNIALIALSNANWITCHSIPARNWAEATLNETKLLEYCTQEELENIRAYHKYSNYVLDNTPSTLTKATRLNGKTVDTGLVREGFRDSGNCQFTYDQDYMDQYKDIIQANLTKSMDKIAELCPNLRHDRASYDTISINIFNYYLESNATYTRGNNYNDSRGRAISESLSKVGNPISCKDFRALIVMPS